MLDSAIVSLVTTASNIATPLALAGLGLGLFFGVLFFLISKLEPNRVAPRHVPRIIIVVVTYGFILSAIALLLGVASWLVGTLFGPILTQNKIEGYLLRKDYQGVIELAEPYLKSNPKDDVVRHMLGTSYYVEGSFEKGIANYREMEKLYAELDQCSRQRREAISSLAAFFIGQGRPKDGLRYSKMILQCKDVTDGYIFNHYKLLAMDGDEVVLTFPPNRSLKSSYFQSKYALVKFVFLLQKYGHFVPEIMPLLVEAYCEDEKVKSIIQRRFNSGDFSSSEVTAQDFAFELAIFDKFMDDVTRKNVLIELKSAPCVADRISSNHVNNPTTEVRQ
jgi:hypothetical protein